MAMAMAMARGMRRRTGVKDGYGLRRIETKPGALILGGVGD